MLNTKCERCLFANSVSDTSSLQCSQNIIDQIKSYKTVTQENNFNVIQEYACRYGFSKDIYEQNKENLKDVDLLDQINKNTQIKYYLLLDINKECNIDNIIETLNNLDIKPQFVSVMFREPDDRRFEEQDKQTFVSKSLIPWKCHNFIEPNGLQQSIDHILSTNMQNSKSLHFLVYNSLDLDQLSKDILVINNNLILYQKPNIAMLKNLNTLYGLFMSFENYKVAKSFGDDILQILKEESEILQF
jgi:hypothetical protein